jgi:hypothetical protein
VESGGFESGWVNMFVLSGFASHNVYGANRVLRQWQTFMKNSWEEG